VTEIVCVVLIGVTVAIVLLFVGWVIYYLRKGGPA